MPNKQKILLKSYLKDHLYKKIHLQDHLQTTNHLQKNLTNHHLYLQHHLLHLRDPLHHRLQDQ
jgi:hypothetical protein